MILLIGGGVVGVRIGYVKFGFWGAVIGLPLGVTTGLIVSCLIAFLLNTLLPKRPDTKGQAHEETVRIK